MISHKRVIESVTEKGQAFIQATSNKDGGKEVQKTVSSINKRYEELVDNLLKTITELEEALDYFQQFNDLQKSHLDYQKQLWDRLSGYTGKSRCMLIVDNSKNVEHSKYTEFVK